MIQLRVMLVLGLATAVLPQMGRARRANQERPSKMTPATQRPASNVQMGQLVLMTYSSLVQQRRICSVKTRFHVTVLIGSMALDVLN